MWKVWQDCLYHEMFNLRSKLRNENHRVHRHRDSILRNHMTNHGLVLHFFQMSVLLGSMYSCGGNSGNPHMFHLYIHMFGFHVVTNISFTSCLSLTFIAFIRKTTLFVIFFNDLIDIFVSILFFPHFPFLSFVQLLPHNPWPRP